MSLRDTTDSWTRTTRYSVAVLLWLVSLGVRYVVVPHGAGFPYFSFYPSVVIAFYLLGLGPGVLAIGLGLVSGYFLFTPVVSGWVTVYGGAVAAALFLFAGGLVGYVVHQLHIAVARWKSALADLARSEERAHTILDDQTDWICRTSAAGALLYTNPAFRRCFGSDDGQAADSSWRSIVAARDMPGIEAQLAALSPAAPTLTLEYAVYDAQGREIWGHFVHTGIFDANGVLLEIQSVGRDISDRRAAENKARMLELELRESQKLEAIGTLAGGIAHDINNAITTILGNASLARDDAGNTARLGESLDEIRRAGLHARDVVQQILSFSRRQPTQRTLTDFGDVVRDSTRFLRAALPSTVSLAVRIADNLPQVLADPTQLKQVVINLVTNAVQAMAGRQGSVHVSLAAIALDAQLLRRHSPLRALGGHQPGHAVCLTVVDDGPGMDDATLQRIFDPFFTTRKTGEGTGLGLAVVHGITKTHQGAMVVESELGMGTQFRFFLPEAGPASDPGTALPVSVSEREPVAGGSLHILYLDDDISLVFLVTRMLQRKGIRVSGFTRQEEALAALRAAPAAFDLFVTDFSMPGKSGLDVIQEARRIVPGLAVAIASGFPSDHLVAGAKAIGVTDIVFKPVAVEELGVVLSELARRGHRAIATMPAPAPAP
jgi:PAS domain S-box-containing protein